MKKKRYGWLVLLPFALALGAFLIFRIPGWIALGHESVKSLREKASWGAKLSDTRKGRSPCLVVRATVADDNTLNFSAPGARGDENGASVSPGALDQVRSIALVMQTTGTRKAQHERQEEKPLSNGQIEVTTYQWETDVYKTRILFYDTATREFIWESNYSFESYVENTLTEKMLGDIRGALIAEAPGEQVVWANQDGVAYFRQNGKIGLMDSLGNILLAPVLDLALPFENGIARVNQNGLWGLLDRSGTFVSEPQWDALEPFSEGVAVIAQNSQYGYLSTNGEVLCRPRRRSAEAFQNGVGEVEEQTAAGPQTRLIDAQGNVSDLIFKWYDPDVSQGLVYTDGGYYNIAGNLVFELRDRYGADMGYPFKEGRALISRTREGKTLYGVVDTQGTLVSELQWEWVDRTCYENGLLSVAKGDQACLLDPQGKVVATPPTGGKSLSLPSEGLCRFRQNGTYGFCTIEGEQAIAPKWSEAHDFSEGLAAVSKGGAWGYIDRSGMPVIECSFEWALDFQGGRAFANKDELWGVIDSSGAWIIQPSWKNLQFGEQGIGGKWNHGFVTDADGVLYGVVSPDGKVISPTQWDQVRGGAEAFPRVTKDGGVFYLDADGEIIVGL